MITPRERVSYGEVTHAQFKDLQKRMDGLEKELDRVNIHLDRLEDKVEKIDEKLNAKIDKLTDNINDLRKDIQSASNHGNIMTATVIGIALAVVYSILK